MDKVWEIKDPESYLKAKNTAPRPVPLPREERDPASAYNRSLLAWGLGQLYNDQVVKGTVFLVLMLFTIFGTVLGAIYRLELYRVLLSHGISPSTLFLAGEALLFSVLLFWVHNAADAYFFAARRRRTRFIGVNSTVAPSLCSLVLPGWGQYLNGQPVKGAFCASLAVLGVFSVLTSVFTYRIWPFLDAGTARFTIEGIFAVSLLFLPLVPAIWVFSVHDAFKVSSDDLLKEPLWERMKAAYYRGRTQGWVRGVFPQIQGTFLLVLFLTFFIIVVHFWFPTGFYTRKLAAAQTLLQGRGMTIVPELIGKMLEFIASW